MERDHWLMLCVVSVLLIMAFVIETNNHGSHFLHELGLGATAAILDRPTGLTGYYDVKTFGAVCDGKTDDSAKIQQALNTAFSAGGGTVTLPAARCAIAQTIKIPTKVSLSGQPGGRLVAIRDNLETMVLVDETSLAGNREGAMRDLTIDCARKAKTGLKLILSIQRLYENLRINNCKHIGLHLSRAQNNEFIGVDVERNGTYVLSCQGARGFICGAGISLDNGAGNNVFLRSEVSNNIPYQLLLWDDPHVQNEPGGYKYGPTGNKFIGSIFERAEEGTFNQIYIRSGRNNEIQSSVISATFLTRNFTGVRVTSEDLTAGCALCRTENNRFIGGTYNGTANHTTAFSVEGTDRPVNSIFVENIFFENHKTAFRVNSPGKIITGLNNIFGNVGVRVEGNGVEASKIQ